MKKKLKISQLKVSSFVTELDSQTNKTIYGASGIPCDPPTTRCITPIVASKDVDCAFTRVNNICIVNTN